MISETRFAKSYASVWRGLAPTLELFVRKANLRLVERTWVPLGSVTDPAKRALINRVAFEAVKLADGETLPNQERQGWLGITENLKRSELGVIDQNFLTDGELREVESLARRMCTNLFRMQRSPVTLSPAFAGCGIINSCFGDAITANGRVIEMKDGDRPFRSYEFRQLVIYAALLMNNGGGIASEFQVMNSRRGTSVIISVDEFSREAAGQSPVDFLTEVIRAISDATIYQS